MKYAAYWNPDMGRLPERAREAVAVGPVPVHLLPQIDGYGRGAGGAIEVAIRTDLPGVDARMIDWWFGWHGDDSDKYRLWHPRAHVAVRWAAPGTGYLGRTSLVDEYIGDALQHASISFVAPPPGDFAVCANIGVTGTPVEAGRLEHRIEPVTGGCVMWSRFWIGGPHARVRAGFLGGPLSTLARRIAGPKRDFGRDLLVHCAQEMAHLGTFLPRLYADLAMK